MPKTNPSYSDLASRLGISRCPGVNGCAFSHNGSWDIFEGQPRIHWADRHRVERAGVRRFLMLAAIAHVAAQGEYRPWARMYRAQGLVSEWAKTIGMRMPSSATDRDAVTLRAMLVNVPTDEPLRKEAMDWAQRK